MTHTTTSASDQALREALEELADDLDNHHVVMVAGRALRDLLAAHPIEPTVAYAEYGVRYTSGPRKGSMARRFRDLADAVEFVARGSQEMVVLHRVVTMWTEVTL